jgi:hypothetical protein
MELRSERKMEKAASKAHHLPDPLFTGRHGRSAINIPSRANGAFGLHRRHDSDGIRLEIAPPGCRSSVRRSNWPHAGHETVNHGKRAAIAAPIVGLEPKNPPAGLARIPNGDDVLRVCDRLALGLGALCLGRCTSGGSLAFLRSAVRTHGRGSCGFIYFG